MSPLSAFQQRPLLQQPVSSSASRPSALTVINSDELFLQTFIAQHHVQLSTRWNDDRINALALEAAAIGHNPGGYSTRQLIHQIKVLLAGQG